MLLAASGVGFCEREGQQTNRVVVAATHPDGRWRRINPTERIKRMRARQTLILTRRTAVETRPVLRLVLLVLLIWPRGRQRRELRTHPHRHGGMDP